jgi:hypothetical protein
MKAAVSTNCTIYNVFGTAPVWCLRFIQWCIFIEGSSVCKFQAYRTIGESYFHYTHIQEHSSLKIAGNFQAIKQGLKNLILYLSKYSSVIGSAIFQNEKFHDILNEIKNKRAVYYHQLELCMCLHHTCAPAYARCHKVTIFIVFQLNLWALVKTVLNTGFHKRQ